MHRFFVPPELLATEDVRLPPETAHQVVRVLRLRAGARVVLFGGDAGECEAVLQTVRGDLVVARVAERRLPDRELPCRLAVALAVLKGDKADWVVQKLTELGACRISFLQAERSVAGAADERWPKRLERYARIAREAAEQCGAVRIPQVDGPWTLEALLARGGDGPAIFLHPEAPVSLPALLGDEPGALLLLVGPEGGFTPGELETATAAGAVPARLGRRILRAETAAIAAAAVAAAAMDRV